MRTFSGGGRVANRQLLLGANTTEIKSIDSFLNESLLGVAPAPTSNPLHIYATVAYLYRCIDVRANALLAMPWSIYRGDTELVRHDVDEWPKELAAFASLEELLWQTEAALCLVSEAYWYKRRSRLGVTNVRWLDPTTMSPIWGVDSITAFKRQVGVAVSTLSVEDIVYLRMAGVSETMPRPAPAHAALSAAGVLYNVNEFAAAFFKRGAIKATLLTVEGNPPPAERERLKAWWQRFFTGINKAFAAEVVSAAVTPVVIGEGLSELTNTELTATEREEIATALGVPHSLVMSNAANFATAEADRLTFYDMTVVPQANAIARQLNAQLFAPAGMRFEWHPQELQIYQTDENERASAFATYVNAGIKQSIAAQMLGLNLPEGVEPEDLDPEPQPVQLQQAAQDAQQQGANNGVQDTQGQGQQGQQQGQAPVAPDARQQEARKFLRWAKGKRNPHEWVSDFVSLVLSDDDKRALLLEHADVSTRDGWQAFKALMLQHDPGDDNSAEERMLLEIEARAQRDIAKALRAQFRDLLPPNAEDMDIVELQAYIEQRLGSQAVHDAIDATVRRAVDAGVNLAADQLTTLGVGFDYTMIHTAAREWARQYSAELIQGIDNTTRTAVRESVARWYTNGEPLSALTNDLSSIFDERRARLIAQTETTSAASNGTLRGYEASGVVTEMVFLTASDERVCAWCGSLDGQTVSLSGNFSDKLPPELQAKLRGRAIKVPPIHPGCRCRIGARVLEVPNA